MTAWLIGSLVSDKGEGVALLEAEIFSIRNLFPSSNQHKVNIADLPANSFIIFPLSLLINLIMLIICLPFNQPERDAYLWYPQRVGWSFSKIPFFFFLYKQKFSFREAIKT